MRVCAAVASWSFGPLVSRVSLDPPAATSYQIRSPRVSLTHQQRGASCRTQPLRGPPSDNRGSARTPAVVRTVRARVTRLEGWLFGANGK